MSLFFYEALLFQKLPDCPWEYFFAGVSTLLEDEFLPTTLYFYCLNVNTKIFLPLTLSTVLFDCLYFASLHATLRYFNLAVRCGVNRCNEMGSDRKGVLVTCICRDTCSPLPGFSDFLRLLLLGTQSTINHLSAAFMNSSDKSCWFYVQV